ncbi:MAG: hypothetical protein H7Y59_01725 [Anaerolineales bacterium]|nr:hypothetical protein [Anaerolineales bacterium]
MIKKTTAIFAMCMLTIFLTACMPSSPLVDTTPADVVGTLETAIAASPLSTENVDELIVMINDFVASGEITGQAENGLLAKLETIRQKVAEGQFDPAANEIKAFVNQVQAQLGKKISEPAATALISKAQEVAAELMAGVPVTGAGTAVPTTSSSTNMPKPTPMGDQLEHQPQWDAVALLVTQSVGISTFDYDLYQLPADASWEDTLAYYQTQAADTGWGNAPSQTDEMSAGHYAVWSAAGPDGKTNYFVVAQVDAPDGTFTLNIAGE